MAILRFTTTHLSGLQAAGRLQEMQHSTIVPFLERELGAEYGRLFAEYEVESSDVRAWYVDAYTPPRAIATLPPAEQDALRRRLGEMVQTILDFAARIASESPQKANLSRILTAATTFPAEDIWAVGDQPVIVNWGFHRQNVPVGAPRAILELVKAPPKPPPPKPKPQTAPPVVTAPQVVVTEKGPPAFLMPALLWLGFVILVGAAYNKLLPACGLKGAALASIGPLNACPVETQGDRLARESTELKVMVDQTALQIAERKQQCPVPPEHHSSNETTRPDRWTEVRRAVVGRSAIIATDGSLPSPTL